MNNIYLISAWNDSGAGNLMRRLDDSGEINVMPFETLLGNSSKFGISRYANLGRPAYRWNIFRESEFFDQINYDEDIFEEPELNSWLKGLKFSNFDYSKDDMKKNLKKFWNSMIFYDNDKLNSLITHILITNNYILNLSNYFFGISNNSLLIHVPCISLDFNNPVFNLIIKKTIHLFIDPFWGFGNMHKRNGINFERYLNHWYIINKSALNYKKNYPDKLTLLKTNSTEEEIFKNSITALDFLKTNYSKNKLNPTILGKNLDNQFYPYGGLKNISKDYVTECKLLAKKKKYELTQDGIILLEKCENLLENLSNEC